jgi:hypothetical protein
MTRRKFKPTTRGGYWVRSIEERETDGPFVFRAQVGNHSSEQQSEDPADWAWETFTANGAYRFNIKESPMDLIEDTE